MRGSSVQGRRTSASGLLVLALCVGLPGGQASAETVQERLQESMHDLEDSTQEVQEAAAALRDVAAQLPAARREVALARGELQGARTRAAQAAKAALAAEVARQGAQARVDAVVARVEAGKRTVARLARQSYERGPVDVQPVFRASDASDYLQRTAMLQQVFTGQNDGLRALAEDRVELAQTTAELAGDEAVAEAARDEAAAGAQRAQAVTDRAQRAEDTVEQLTETRRSALATAEAARADDQQAYAQAQRDSEALAARLREAARVRKAEAARVAAADRARKAAAEAAAKEAARRAAAAARTRTRSTPSTPTVTQPDPVPTTPARRPTGSGWVWPAIGPMTSAFGYRVHPIYGDRRLHAGIDIGAGQGTPTYAAQDGVVVFAGVQSGYGNAIAVSHGIKDGRDVVSFYAHQSAMLVRAGQSVSRGQTIGRVGSTGDVTGPHLHFEVRLDGSPVDPLGYVSPR